MKRSLVFLFIAMLLAATGCMTEHEHIWDGYQVIAESMCADDGETVFTCTL